MATEILLLADVKDLGAEGDVVTVADGYARNHLLPGNLAAPVTKEARARLAKIREERIASHESELASARELAAQIAGISCTVAVKTGEGEKMYGSVTALDIAEQARQQGVEFDRHMLQIEAPIKELGVYDIPVKLHPEVQTTLKVWIVEE